MSGTLAEQIVEQATRLADVRVECERLRRELDDIRERLRGGEDSVLAGPNGLVQATIDSHDAAVAECERLRAAMRSPSAEAIGSACMACSHDYGMMTEAQRHALERDAVEWLAAWGRAIEVVKGAKDG